jgi:hypothetical protein
MKESFLHYIWQFQYFDKVNLLSSSGEPLQILHTGVHHSNSGPDFLEARIRIGPLEWRGSVEIHLKSSGWIEHKHSDDPAYDSVILHVVWEDDKSILRNDGSPIPTLQLRERVSEKMMEQYRKLLSNPESIPCARSLSSISDITKLSTIDRVLINRLEAKSNIIIESLKKAGNDWEQVTYQLLCRNLGFKVNSQPMENLGSAMPYRILLKHADQLIQVEALLFGQAGFLEHAITSDAYATILLREYQILSNKYELESMRLNAVQWKFLRMRPVNFPTIRIAQLSWIVSNYKNLFSRILEANTTDDARRLFSLSLSDYWKEHYQLGKKFHRPISGSGKSSVDNIIINTMVPLLAANGRLHNDQS